MLPDTGKSLAD